MPQPDPERFMNQFVSWEVATKENKWQGRNISRWRNDEYDEAFRRPRGRARSGQARRAVHPHERPGRRRATAIIPLVEPARASSASLEPPAARLSGWDSDLSGC